MISQTTNAIFKAYNKPSYHIESYDDLAKWLTSLQQNGILGKFEFTNQFRLGYFQLPNRERELLFSRIRNGQVSMDDYFGPQLPA